MKKAQGFNQERKYGVEVEFFGVDGHRVARELDRRGIDAAYEGYTHRTTNHWKVVTDGSVNRYGTGYELVSPPISGDEGLAELERALEILNELGAKVDRTCGVHVHHDASDFDIKAFKNVFGIYSRFETALDELMPLFQKR